jgi:hypothetical protein
VGTSGSDTAIRLDFNKFINALFERVKEIAYVGIVDNQGELIASTIRQGAKTYTTPEGIREFMRTAPAVVMDALEKVRAVVGSVEFVTVRYEKRVIVLKGWQEKIVVVGCERDIPTPFSDRVVKTIEDLVAELG